MLTSKYGPPCTKRFHTATIIFSSAHVDTFIFTFTVPFLGMTGSHWREIMMYGNAYAALVTLKSGAQIVKSQRAGQRPTASVYSLLGNCPSRASVSRGDMHL